MNRDYDSLWDAAWNEAASHGPGFRSRYALLLRFLARYGTGERLIDVGAGHGHLLLAIHKAWPQLQLSAIEHGPAALAALGAGAGFWARGFFSGAPGRSRPIWAAPGGEAEQASYDSVICSEVLEHVRDHERLLDALCGLLVPGGRLFLTVPLRPKLWTSVDDHVGHQRRYRSGELADLCRQRGLLIDQDLALGFPLYNSYYSLLGRRPPGDTAARAKNSSVAHRLADVLTLLFRLENHFPSPLGARGLVIASKPA